MSNAGKTLTDLTSSPIAGLLVTIAVYAACYHAYRRSGLKPALNPVFTAASILVALLLLCGIDYESYFRGAQLIHFLLGPAVVALAVPLFKVFQRVREASLSILSAVLSGALVAATYRRASKFKCSDESLRNQSGDKSPHSKSYLKRAKPLSRRASLEYQPRRSLHRRWPPRSRNACCCWPS